MVNKKPPDSKLAISDRRRKLNSFLNIHRMSKLEQNSNQSKSSEDLSEETQANHNHSHPKSNAEILTVNGVKSVWLNRRKAIRYRCLDCSGFEINEVTGCKHTDCPLYPYRTINSRQDPNKRRKAIRDYCMWCMLDQPGEITKCMSPDCPLFIFRGYNLPIKNVSDRDSCSENITGEPPEDLSFESDSDIPPEEVIE